jgi:hypothetical protein
MFYTKRFCVPCVKKNITEFPDEIKSVSIMGRVGTPLLLSANRVQTMHYTEL